MLKRISDEEVRVYGKGLNEPKKDFRDSKNPYPYGGIYRIVKFYNRNREYVGECQGAITTYNGEQVLVLYTGHDARKQFKYTAFIKVENESTFRNSYVSWVVKDFELPVIKLS